MRHYFRYQLLSKLINANESSSLNTSDAENKVIMIFQYFIYVFNKNNCSSNKLSMFLTQISILQAFLAANSKEEYLTNMAKLILAVEIKDFREVRQFCGE